MHTTTGILAEHADSPYQEYSGKSADRPGMVVWTKPVLDKAVIDLGSRQPGSLDETTYHVLQLPFSRAEFVAQLYNRPESNRSHCADTQLTILTTGLRRKRDLTRSTQQCRSNCKCTTYAVLSCRGHSAGLRFSIATMSHEASRPWALRIGTGARSVPQKDTYDIRLHLAFAVMLLCTCVDRAGHNARCAYVTLDSAHLIISCQRAQG